MTMANMYNTRYIMLLYNLHVQHTIVAEWLPAWDTLTMFEVTVCGRS